MSRRYKKKQRPKSKKQPIQPKSNPHVSIKPKTDGQEDFWDAMEYSRLIICDGPSGSGKSILSAAKGLELLVKGDVEKMIISRPCVDASSRGIGFLPGDLKDKVAPYMVPILEEIDKCVGREIRRKLFEEGHVKIEPLEFLRGRNFHDTFMVLDEGSNCTFEQLVMFATRMGKNSKCVISGDFNQTDLIKKDNDFSKFIDKMDVVEYDNEDIVVCSMTTEDIVRDPIVSKILERCGLQ